MRPPCRESSQTVTVTQASIADLIEQRDALLEVLKEVISLADECAAWDAENVAALDDPGGCHIVDVPSVTPRRRWLERAELSRRFAKRAHELSDAAIAKASPIAGLTEIGEEEVKNSTASQSEPVLTPKSAIGDAENYGPHYTPGPWSVRPELDSERRFSRLIGANIDDDGRPRDVPARNGGIWVAEAKGPDCKANARLISAAPELLEALKMCVIERTEWLEEARTAIARAEGRTPTSRSAPDDGALAPITPGDSGRTQP